MLSSDPSSQCVRENNPIHLSRPFSWAGFVVGIGGWGLLIPHDQAAPLGTEALTGSEPAPWGHPNVGFEALGEGL